jgi:hypothetical protein
MIRTSLLITVALLTTAITALAAGPTTYRGTTDQGYKAYVKVRMDGELGSVNVPWNTKARNCKPRDGYSIGNGKPYVYTNSKATPIVREGNRFSAHRHEVFKVSGGGKAVIDGRLTGKFSGKRATGKSRMTIKSNDSHGRHTCKRTVDFAVKRTGG